MKKGCFILFFIMSILQSIVAQQFVLTPQWTPQSQFAAFYVALEKGLYREAGLDVKIEHPSLSSTSIDRLKEGSCNIVTLELTNAIILADEGCDVLNILQLCNHSNNVIISNKKISENQKLLIGVPKYAVLKPIGNIFYKNDIEVIQYLNAVNIFVTKAVDAVFGKSYNELINIRMTGAVIENVMYMKDLGYDIPEDGIYVKREFYEQYPEQCKIFAQVTKDAWEWVSNNIDESIDIVMKYVKDANINSNKNHQRFMLEEYMKSMRKNNGEYDFMLNEEDFLKVSQMLKQYNVINSDVNFKDFVRDVL